MRKIKMKVDEQANIAIFWQPTSNFPEDKDKITDYAMAIGYARYKGLSSPVLTVSRHQYFCILAHGTRTHASHLNDQESLGWFKNAHATYGKNRPILLLSCLTGLQLARRLAPMVHVDVVAPTGLATIDPDGTVRCGIPDMVPPDVGKLNWMRVATNGAVTMAGTEVLHPRFLSAGYIPQIDIKR